MTNIDITEFRTMLARLMHIGSGIDRDYGRSELMEYQVRIEVWLGNKIGRPLSPGQLIEFRIMTGTLFGILSKIADGINEKDDLVDHQIVIEKWVDVQTGKALTAKYAPDIKITATTNGKPFKLK